MPSPLTPVSSAGTQGQARGRARLRRADGQLQRRVAIVGDARRVGDAGLEVVVAVGQLRLRRGVLDQVRAVGLGLDLRARHRPDELALGVDEDQVDRQVGRRGALEEGPRDIGDVVADDARVARWRPGGSSGRLVSGADLQRERGAGRAARVARLVEGDDLQRVVAVGQRGVGPDNVGGGVARLPDDRLAVDVAGRVDQPDRAADLGGAAQPRLGDRRGEVPWRPRIVGARASAVSAAPGGSCRSEPSAAASPGRSGCRPGRSAAPCS